MFAAGRQVSPQVEVPSDIAEEVPKSPERAAPVSVNEASKSVPSIEKHGNSSDFLGFEGGASVRQFLGVIEEESLFFPISQALGRIESSETNESSVNSPSSQPIQDPQLAFGPLSKTFIESQLDLYLAGDEAVRGSINSLLSIQRACHHAHGTDIENFWNRIVSSDSNLEKKLKTGVELAQHLLGASGSGADFVGQRGVVCEMLTGVDTRESQGELMEICPKSPEREACIYTEALSYLSPPRSESQNLDWPDHPLNLHLPPPVYSHHSSTAQCHGSSDLLRQKEGVPRSPLKKEENGGGVSVIYNPFYEGNDMEMEGRLKMNEAEKGQQMAAKRYREGGWIQRDPLRRNNMVNSAVVAATSLPFDQTSNNTSSPIPQKYTVPSAPDAPPLPVPPPPHRVTIPQKSLVAPRPIEEFHCMDEEGRQVTQLVQKGGATVKRVTLGVISWHDSDSGSQFEREERDNSGINDSKAAATDKGGKGGGVVCEKGSVDNVQCASGSAAVLAPPPVPIINSDSIKIEDCMIAKHLKDSEPLAVLAMQQPSAAVFSEEGKEKGVGEDFLVGMTCEWGGENSVGTLPSPAHSNITQQHLPKLLNQSHPKSVLSAEQLRRLEFLKTEKLELRRRIEEVDKEIDFLSALDGAFNVDMTGSLSPPPAKTKQPTLTRDTARLFIGGGSREKTEGASTLAPSESSSNVFIAALGNSEVDMFPMDSEMLAHEILGRKHTSLTHAAAPRGGRHMPLSVAAVPPKEQRRGRQQQQQQQSCILTEKIGNINYSGTYSNSSKELSGGAEGMWTTARHTAPANIATTNVKASVFRGSRPGQTSMSDYMIEKRT